MKHLKYLRYVLRHKWFVLRAGLMLKARGHDIPLRNLLLHDLSKLTLHEWFPYVWTFYGPEPLQRREDGGYDATAISREFDYAWLSHQRNKHHWQAWVLLKDDGTTKPLEMPYIYAAEMVADWMGAGMAINGHGLDQAFMETVNWYEANQGKMVLHPATRRVVEGIIYGQYRQYGWAA